ncbi:gamma-interferon-responsive lysosomal thiol protein-like [Actinidia eriantha]|uniref:gamma-interferon-responsive lysosomal thiol protein-like n=1 Tax=Actinidia eriantha TaxID=165200 RepID=UPI00258C504C|nr:gamma-interferon-responsive lysosomal thiol protein-like [Actinidia eriantha]
MYGRDFAINMHKTMLYNVWQVAGETNLDIKLHSLVIPHPSHSLPRLRFSARATADEDLTPSDPPPPSTNLISTIQTPISTPHYVFSSPITLSLLSYLLFFTPISAALSSSSPPDSSDKVSLGLYYESLCPYSANFIINYLFKIFENGLISAVDLNLVPWGNARIHGNNTFSCQHGPPECLLNTIEACAIEAWPDLNKHFSFIYCVETLVYERKYPEWETCFDKLGLDPTPITECYSSSYGNEVIAIVLHLGFMLFATSTARVCERIFQTFF